MTEPSEDDDVDEDCDADLFDKAPVVRRKRVPLWRVHVAVHNEHQHAARDERHQGVEHREPVFADIAAARDHENEQTLQEQVEGEAETPVPEAFRDLFGGDGVRTSLDRQPSKDGQENGRTIAKDDFHKPSDETGYWPSRRRLCARNHATYSS